MVQKWTVWLLLLIRFNFASDEIFQDCFSDIIFLLDGSDSIDLDEFTVEKEFVKNVTRRIYLDEFSGATIGTYSFSKYVFGTGLRPFQKSSVILENIDDLPFEQEGTWTHSAIRVMSEVFETEKRPGVNKVGVILSDGRSKFQKNTLGEADLAKLAGTYLVTIGIGHRINREELRLIATNGTSFVLSSSGANLEEIIARIACRGSPETNP